MQYKTLMGTHLTASAIGIGTMGMVEFYGPTNDKQAAKALEHAISLGINFIDTADMYGRGHSEELISKLIDKQNRDKLIISTKCGFVRPSANLNDMYLDNSPAYIKKACEASLKRLKTDYIDIYFLHRIDGKTPIEDSIGTMKQLVQEGKIRYIGLSNTSIEIINAACSIHPITAYQEEYSLWHRFPEESLLATCKKLKINFIPYSPLGRGFLSGKIRSHEQIESHDFRKTLPRFQSENLKKNLLLLNELQKIADDKNCTLAQLALAWLLTKDSTLVPIPGAKTAEQIQENWGALNVDLTSQDMERLNQIMPLDCAAGAAYPDNMAVK